ncbi:MAG: hypothetical protein HZB53_19575 [Chloroflexi bacterium]|nr:hypothetical protein [Chloroflexota bacterium]
MAADAPAPMLRPYDDAMAGRGDRAPTTVRRTRPRGSSRPARSLRATDRQIDALVHELYGLTDEEIAVMEG